MTNINKHPLPKEQAALLQTQFDRLVGSLSEKQSGAFFSELLGIEERIMLTKRLGAISMLNDGYSRYRVAKTLALSPATTEALAEKMSTGRYDDLLKVLGSNNIHYRSFKESLLNLIDTALYLSSPKAPADYLRTSLRPK